MCNENYLDYVVYSPNHLFTKNTYTTIFLIEHR